MNQTALPKTELLKRTKAYVENYLSNKVSEKYCYHNLDHTKEAVEAVKKIGLASNLSPVEMEEVLLAAWLHDTGYAKCSNGHEEESIQITRDVLSQNGASEDKIEKVVNCILATKYPQNPHNLMEKVMCDADMSHLASEDYFEKSELLRRELSFIKGYEIEQEDWAKTNLRFFKSHQYLTPYGKTVLTELKEKNQKKLKKIVKEKEGSELSIDPHSYKEKMNGEEKKGKDRNKEIKQDKPRRGIETMFRTTSHNHLELSAIADNKANIMISINAIIISILVSVLFRKLEEYPHLIIPTILLTMVCLLTIVFAILATRPNVTEGKFNKEDIKKKKTNLLFFGNFHNMSLEDYEWGIKEIMKDSDYLYSSMIRDIYFLGKVLGRKYRLLRISYTIFMFGFVISILAFGISMILYPPQGIR